MNTIKNDKLQTDYDSNPKTISQLILEGLAIEKDVTVAAAIKIHRALKKDARKRRRRRPVVPFQEEEMQNKEMDIESLDLKSDNLAERFHFISLLDLALPIAVYKVDLSSILYPEIIPMLWKQWVKESSTEAFRIVTRELKLDVQKRGVAMAIKCLENDKKSFGKTVWATCMQELKKMSLYILQKDEQRINRRTIRIEDQPLISDDKENAGLPSKTVRDPNIVQIDDSDLPYHQLAMAIGPSTEPFYLPQSLVQYVLQENEAMVKVRRTTSGTHRVFKVK